MEQRRQAAVVIAIFRSFPHGIIFVERAEHLRDHPGQVGLPGGGVHPEDVDLQATAVRELHEEVGIARERVTIVAQLPMLRQRRANNFDVTPFVAVIEEGELRIDASETAGVFLVPLIRLLKDGLRQERVAYAGGHVQSLVLDYDGRRIWGLTAQILHNFVTAWNDDLAVRVTPLLQAGASAPATDTA